MISRIGLVSAMALICLLTIRVEAQLLDGKRRTGSPTPGTPQPDPPNLADRVTLTGCVQLVAQDGKGQQTAATDPNAPSDSRFVLTNAERQNVVPPGTGGSPLAAKTSSPTYRLDAIEAQLSPFVGTKVEISGEIKTSSPRPPGEKRGNEPTLQVEFVQKIAATCP